MDKMAMDGRASIIGIICAWQTGRTYKPLFWLTSQGVSACRLLHVLRSYLDVNMSCVNYHNRVTGRIKLAARTPKGDVYLLVRLVDVLYMEWLNHERAYSKDSRRIEALPFVKCERQESIQVVEKYDPRFHAVRGDRLSTEFWCSGQEFEVLVGGVRAQPLIGVLINQTSH